jgi:predicted nucleic acid-binding Zn finger protein
MPRKKSEFAKLTKGVTSVWVCAVGRHQEVWDYLIVGNFKSCFDFAWGVLQHEIDLPCSEFKKELKQSNGYIGKFAEIKKVSQKQTFDSGLKVGKSILIFDHPENIELSLSKPVYAGLVPGTPDFVFAHQMYQGIETQVYQNQLKNYYKFQNVAQNQSGLINRELLKYSHYPLIITNSPFILAKIYTEGLIGGFVPNILSIASSKKFHRGFSQTPKKIRSEIRQWVEPYPKNVLIVQEPQKRFCQQENYTELEDYQSTLKEVLEKTNSNLKQISSSISQIEIDQKTTSNQLVEKIKQTLTVMALSQN